MRPYNWEQEANFPEWTHPVELLVRGETDPEIIAMTTAAHLSEMSLSTQQSCEAIDLALRRLDKVLGR